MKLISCYIENYGKIKSKEYRFFDGITALYADNGEGKTTLASFIKAMFYGLEGYRKGASEFCDREHFYPFDGGLFGGNLTFETEGKVYKIERFFGEKSKTTDSVKVYCNGELTTELGEEIGKTVFGVDKESFERTLFLHSGDLEMSSTSGIHAKLNRFLEGGAEDGNLDEALAKIEKAAKVYKKSKAGSDRVTAETQRLMRLEEEVENATRIKRALEEKYVREKGLEEEIDKLSKEVVAAQQQNEIRARFEHFDDINARIASAQKNLDVILAKYPLGVPAEEEILAFNEYMGRAKDLTAKAEGIKTSFKETEKFASLEEKFVRGVPSEEVLFTVEKDVETLSRCKAEAKLYEEKKRGAREEALCAKFARGCPSDETLSSTQRKVEAYKQQKAEYDRTPAYRPSPSTSQKTGGKKYALWAAFALLLCVGGAVGLFINTVVGVVALVVGGILLLVDGFLYLNKKSAPQASVENAVRSRLEQDLRALEDRIKAQLLPFGYCSGNGVVFDFASLEADVVAYKQLVQEEDARAKQLLEKRGQMAESEQKLSAFFQEYGLSGDNFGKLLTDLRVCVNDYHGLRLRKTQSEQLRAQTEAEQLRLSVQIEAFRTKYALRVVTVTELLEDGREIKRLQKEMADGRAQAASYQAEKGLGDRATLERVDLATLQHQLVALQNERGKLEREIASDEMEAERLEELETEKTQTEERLKEYKHKHKLLLATADLLRQAEGRLRDKYVKPIKDEFLFYAQIIEKALGEKVVMTKDFELRFERNGQDRSERHLSSGQRSICVLCFRLALIKNMYPEGLPFLILDDPFVHLDEAHMSKVGEVLQTLSKNMQMIYFTCHESRKL